LLEWWPVQPHLLRYLDKSVALRQDGEAKIFAICVIVR
jgi:hypothetical protein